MRDREKGFVIAIKIYGESSAIVKIFFEKSGFLIGFTKLTKSSRLILQSGNLVFCDHFSRSEDSLKSFSRFDLIEGFNGKIIFDKTALICTKIAIELLDKFFLEGQNHSSLYLQTYYLFTSLTNDLNTKNFPQNQTQKAKQPKEIFGNKNSISSLVKFELAILEELGLGLDLSSCVATGIKENLSFVSPKSAKAVSSYAAKGYESLLLPMPEFLLNEENIPRTSDLICGLKLSGFFLQKLLFAEKKVEETRLIKNLRQNLINSLAS